MFDIIFAFVGMIKIYRRIIIQSYPFTNMNLREQSTHIEDDFTERSAEAWRYKYIEHNQNYVVMSIIDALGDKPAAIKIYGMYSSMDEANKVSERISSENDYFNVYVASSNQWLPIPPTKEFIENVVYQEKRMQELHDSFTKKKERDAEQLKKMMDKNSRKEKEAIANGSLKLVKEEDIGVEESKN